MNQDQDQSGWGLLVSFHDQSESYTLGFEAGMLWQRLQNGERDLAATVHTDNLPTIRSMATHHGLQAMETATDVLGWTDITLAPAPRKLSLVRQ